MQPPHATMITSDRGVVITGGQFNQYNNYHGQASSGNKAPIDILTEVVAPNALHNSGASFDKPKCHPRTRVEIQEIIMHWIVLGRDKDDQAAKQFMWLNGAAGCGKSAIAQSTIESCIGQRLLLASFFFNRSDPTRNHAGSLVATLAYQLYCAFPETEVQTEILSTIKRDPLVFKKTLQEQFTSLIVQPLWTYFSKDQFAQFRVPFLIVIDGLDECIDRNAQKAILTGFAESFHNSNLCIPIFVTSRPEHDIKLSFGSKSLKDTHTVLSLDLDDPDEADSDIRLYLFDRFAEIKDSFDNRTTGRKLVHDWPGDEVINTLVRMSSGQFIYAATVIHYVESTRHRPDHRLDIILNLRPVGGDHPFAQLDELYSVILESALDRERVLHVLSLHLMVIVSISCSVTEKLLSYEEGEMETLFCDMGALVQVHEWLEDQDYDSECPHLYLMILHASFRDYLLDAARSKQFHIDMDYETVRHATHALQYLALRCSSSFNPESDAGAPMYILCSTQYWMAERIRRIKISLEFRQSILSFPLKEFLEPHNTSIPTYLTLLEDFVTPFLELLDYMVRIDPTLSYIREHQLGTLRAVRIQQVQQYYFHNDRLASILVLFYHLGSHRFVPILNPPISYRWYSNPFYLVPDCHEDDVLSLSCIWEFGDNPYHRLMRQLLHDLGQTAEYALGPIMHEWTALACFKELARTTPLLPTPSWKNIDIAPAVDDVEDDAYPKLSFDSANGGQWRFKYLEKGNLDNEELYFVLLGYLIFLLPRCGRSDTLVAACEKRRTYISPPTSPFAVRKRLFQKEINQYLARVSPTFVSESRI